MATAVAMAEEKGLTLLAGGGTTTGGAILTTLGVGGPRGGAPTTTTTPWPCPLPSSSWGGTSPTLSIWGPWNPGNDCYLLTLYGPNYFFQHFSGHNLRLLSFLTLYGPIFFFGVFRDIT